MVASPHGGNGLYRKALLLRVVWTQSRRTPRSFYSGGTGSRTIRRGEGWGEATCLRAPRTPPRLARPAELSRTDQRGQRRRTIPSCGTYLPKCRSALIGPRGCAFFGAGCQQGGE